MYCLRWCNSRCTDSCSCWGKCKYNSIDGGKTMLYSYKLLYTIEFLYCMYLLLFPWNKLFYTYRCVCMFVCVYNLLIKLKMRNNGYIKSLFYSRKPQSLNCFRTGITTWSINNEYKICSKHIKLSIELKMNIPILNKFVFICIWHWKKRKLFFLFLKNDKVSTTFSFYLPVFIPSNLYFRGAYQGLTAMHCRSKHGFL